MKKVLLFAYFVCVIFKIQSQTIALYPLMSGSSNPPVGTTSILNSNLNAGTVYVGAKITNPTAGTMNSSGLSIKLGSGNNWPNINNDSFSVFLTLSPRANYFYTLTGINFTVNSLNNAEPFFVEPTYQVDGAGPYISLAAPVSINANTTYTLNISNVVFKTSHTYLYRFCFKGTNTTKNQNLRLNNLTFLGAVSQLPEVHTTALSAQPTVGANFSANAQGTYTTGSGIQTVNQSGFCWVANPATPTLANNSNTVAATVNNGVATMNGNISPLNVGTLYNVRSYVIAGTDTIYGETLQVKAQALPTLTTAAASNILSNKATTGGYNIDSGSLAILEKGMCYATTNNPSYSGFHTSNGVNANPFSTVIKSLTPNTKYYIKAFAKNSLGVGYGNLDSFTTSAPVPVITAIPGNLDFGDVYYNASPTVLSYKLSGTYLSPASGSITITPPTGFSVSTTYNGTYSTTPINIAYTGSALPNKVIYVKNATKPYGAASGIIVHSGGGAVAPNVDNVLLNNNVVQNQDTLSNMGTDFWAGFGCQEKMDQKTSRFDTLPGSANGAHLTLYIAAGSQPSTVIVELPGIGTYYPFPKVINIPANSVAIVNGFPIGDSTNPKNTAKLPDTRLYYTGTSNRGIHIYSTNGVPVACWLYDWATNNSAGGSMLFPTNTWNSSYSVLAYGGDKSNTGDPSSYFFVVANQDNTMITFTPTGDIIDSASSPIITGTQGGSILYAKGGTYNVLLKNKGDIFNAIGFINAGTGVSQDLTGTKVSTTCGKKIGVFGGNSRTLITTSSCGSAGSGSDNLIQQMFPSVAWGTKYLTVPTKTMEYNLFRIAVTDITTKVWVDNILYTTASSTWNATGLFYAIEGNKPRLITSDKPISVTQFILPGGYCGGASIGNNGTGDPEMILLSPIQQAIKSATVFCPDFKDNPPSGGAYINVIIPKNGVDSFKIDNKSFSSTVDTGSSSYTGAVYGSSGAVLLKNAFVKHPADTNYYYAKLKVNYPAAHSLSSNAGFNAIAYGTAKGESWGYNAGTAINNLSAINVTLNPNGSDTSTGSVKTVRDNFVYLQIAVPYDSTLIDSIKWDAGEDTTKYKPAGPQNGIINAGTNKPVCLGTIVKDGRTFFIYQSPVKYVFYEEGAYRVKVTLYGTFVSDCGGTDTKNINVIVGKDDINLDYDRTPAGDCLSKKITLKDASIGFAGSTIKTYIWQYGDGSKNDTVKSTDAGFPYPNPNIHTYPANKTYTLTLTTINSIGGSSTDSTYVVLNLLTPPTFSKSADTICIGSSVTFTNTSSSGGVKWFYDYDDGTVDSVSANNPITHTFNISGKKVIKHWIKNSAGCPSDFAYDSIFVVAKPVAGFLAPKGVCLPGTTVFVNNSDTATANNGMPYSYHWDFGTGLAQDTSNKKDPAFQYQNPPGSSGYTVSLTATNKWGCASNIYQANLKSVYPKPNAVIANTSDKHACVNTFGAANFYDSSFFINTGLDTAYWFFGDGGKQALFYNNLPSNVSYMYGIAKLYNVQLVVLSKDGCYSDTASWKVKIDPLPVVATILPSSCITSGSLLFKDNSTVPADDSVQTPYTYTWKFSDRPSDTYTTKDTSHTFTGIGTYYIDHSIITVHGCTDTKRDTFTISGSKPVPKFKVNNSRTPKTIEICVNDSLELIDSSTIAIGTIKKVVIYWDTNNASGVYHPYNLSNTPTIDNNPQNGVGPITPKIYKFRYPYSQFSMANNCIKVVVYNSDSCYSEQYIKINKIYGLPKIVFDTIRGICINGAPKAINLAYDSTKQFDNPATRPLILAKGRPVYSGTGVYNDSMFNPNIAGVGVHDIKVIYELNAPSTFHCYDSALAPITVWALPAVKFDTVNPKCEKQKVQLLDKSTAGAGTGNINSWSWNFGETGSATNTSTLQNPYHTYSGWGQYNISLTVTSDSGCSNSLSPTQAITINPLPKVDFALPKGTCANSPVVFRDKSKIADSSMGGFTQMWYFGDHTPTVSGTPLINPSHTYINPPTDSIKLIVTSNNGCIDSISKVMPAGSIFQKPVAAFKANGVKADTVYACSGSPIQFTDASDSAVDIANWIWGDNGTTVENGNPKSHTYTTATTQTFNGKYYIDDKNGCRSDAIDLIATIWALPTADFDTAKIKCEKDSIQFMDKSFAAGGTGTINKWLWKFGEPASNAADSSKLQNPKHKYATSKQFTVTLIATTSTGCSSAPVSKTINVNPKPLVNFSMPNGVCEGTPVQFTNLSKIADSSMASFTYSWVFGDPNSFANNTSVQSDPPHTYSGGPTDSVRLIVTSDNNCVDSLVKVVSTNIIKPATPSYKIDGVLWDTLQTKQVCLGTPIRFDAGFTAKAYTWTFGDSAGVTHTSIKETHTYPSPVTYKGSFSMIDNNGCITRAVPVNVATLALPTVQFEFDPVVCQGKTITFKDKSITNNGTINSWLWNFGDLASGTANTSNLDTATHTFSIVKTYMVNLTVTNSNGCKATTFPVGMAVNVYPTPKVDFKLPDTVCLPNVATFKDLSSISDGTEAQFTHTWNFGDAGSTGNILIGKPLATATHIYSTSNNYNVTLTVQSKDGCKADSTKVLRGGAIHNKPTVVFKVKDFATGIDSLNNTEPKICVGDSLLFRDLSSNVRYSNWDWGNGTGDITKTPKPQYGNFSAGTYPAKHWIIDNFGCPSDNVNIDVSVKQVPVVQGKTVYTRPNLPVTLTPKYFYANDYKWQLVQPAFAGKTYLNYDNVDYPVSTPPIDLKYLVTAYNDACASVPDSFFVKMLETPTIPSAFSPNGDRINDEWDLGMLKYYAGASVQVFDRFGNTVFSRQVFSQNWNGRVDNSGADCPTGVYYYIIKPGYGVPIMTGYVTILR